MVKPRAAISWSGGKDCCTALLRTHRDFDIVAMLTMFAEDGERSRSHGLRPDIIGAHARAAHLDDRWLGRTITLDAVRELEALGVDPCGEYGEYHTIVTGTPLFNSPLELSLGAREMHSECWALDVHAGAAFTRTIDHASR